MLLLQASGAPSHNRSECYSDQHLRANALPWLPRSATQHAAQAGSGASRAGDCGACQAAMALTTDSPAPSTKSWSVRRRLAMGHPARGGLPSPIGFSPAH